jgi:hypothetical protein
VEALFFLGFHDLLNSLPPQYHSCSAQEDGTDTAFRNVGSYTQDAGKIPRRLLIADINQFKNYYTNLRD